MNNINEDNGTKFFFVNNFGYAVTPLPNESFDDFKERVVKMEELRQYMVKASGESEKLTKEVVEAVDSPKDNEGKKPNWRKCEKHGKWYDSDKYSSCFLCTKEQ